MVFHLLDGKFKTWRINIIGMLMALQYFGEIFKFQFAVLDKVLMVYSAMMYYLCVKLYF